MSDNIFQPYHADLWDLSYQLGNDGFVPNGGIILNNLRHFNYNYARDIRIAGIWINDQPRPLQLGSAVFDIESPLELLDDQEIAKRQIKAPANFDGYQIVGGIRKVFATSKPVIPGTKTTLKITQTFLFSTYGRKPAHEPGGVLDATRIFPVIKFEFSDDNFIDIHPDDKLRRIRIGYRMHISLDAFYFLKDGQLDWLLRPYSMVPGRAGSLRKSILPTPKDAADYMQKNRPNKVGIFRDNEELGAASPFNPTKGIFYAAEKPLQYEICTRGLQLGSSKDEDGNYFWDNIHQWGAYKDFKLLPSAPGVFHASHIHWRWGKAVHHPNAAQKLFLGEAGKDPFSGNREGALLYPGSEWQTIDFAVTKSNIKIEDIDKTVVRSGFQSSISNEFEKMFITKVRNKLPEKIVEGDDLITWFCLEVNRRNSEDPFSGMMFIHGAYFAHNIEQIGLTSITREDNNPHNSVSQRWKRLASGDDYH